MIYHITYSSFISFTIGTISLVKQFIDGEGSFEDFWIAGGDDMAERVLDPKLFSSSFSLLTESDVTIHILERKNFTSDRLVAVGA